MINFLYRCIHTILCWIRHWDLFNRYKHITSRFYVLHMKNIEQTSDPTRIRRQRSKRNRISVDTKFRAYTSLRDQQQQQHSQQQQCPTNICYYPVHVPVHIPIHVPVPYYFVPYQDPCQQHPDPQNQEQIFQPEVVAEPEVVWDPVEPEVAWDQVVVKRHVDIDVNITHIADLLRIIDTYEPDVEYNIDLAAMYNIRHELAQINDMVGMHSFKESLVDQLLYFTQGLYLNSESDYKHMVIYGPPGTGKTQLAKLVGTMYSKLGVLRNQIFRKVTRTDLVAGYLGQTAIKTKKVIEECLGGCLFVDEVYSLGNGKSMEGGQGTGQGQSMEGGQGTVDMYSKECIDTLCEALSDYKDDLMVIVAGYKAQVKHQFFGANPGLESRFIWQFTIDDYTADELRQIFCRKVESNGWVNVKGTDNMSTCTNVKGTDPLTVWMESKMDQFTYFGRDMELLFTHTKIAHGRRIYGQSADQRKQLTMADLDQGYKLFLKHKSSDTTSTTTSAIPFGMYI